MENKKKTSPKKKPADKKITSDQPARTDSSPDRSLKHTDRFPVVGIGASAGGLEAFREFFINMPADSGMGFVLITHLDPAHPSMLSNILGKSTEMSIVEAKDGTRVERNHIYVIPPNKSMSIFGGSLFLLPPDEPRGKRLPIDYFLRSLAEDQGENAVGIILSGTGSDGSLGIKAINEKNGLVMVQDPATADYDGMPRSAIHAGVADFVLPVDKMPERLINFMMLSRPSIEQTNMGAIKQITSILRSRTGHNFSSYKLGTLTRRIEKRMVLHKIDDHMLYARFLQEHPGEIKALLKEILICVTSFFRDPRAFEELKAKGLPKLMEQMGEEKKFRAWVPACATGEEAFSIAMVLQEYMEEHGLDLPVQIFATDISEEAISNARTGLYSENIEPDVGQKRIKKFFIKENGHYRINKSIREMVIFAVQNVIQDVPFTHLDLLSCRNLLIYMEPELQEELIPRFHYSLNPGGILFLGTAESIGHFHDLFSVMDRKWKLFQARDVGRGHGGYRLLRQERQRPVEEAREKPKNIGDIFRQQLLRNLAPVALLVNSKMELVYSHGDPGKYFRIREGEPSRNILELARESLRPVLSSAIYNVINKDRESSYREVEMKVDGKTEYVNIFARPAGSPDLESMAIITMESVVPKPASKPVKGKTSPPDIGRIRELEEELASSRESLNTTIEEMQTSNEELKSTNEELQSANEELQSTNEELESSKEELQSINEELSTLNSELQANMDELVRAQSDFKVLLDSTKIGIIFLDNNLRIRRFTDSATQVINLIPSDVGRPLSDIVKLFQYDELYKDAQQVINTLVPIERQIQTKKEEFYLLRIVPYRTIENVIDGVVITFTSISELKKFLEKEAKRDA